MARKTHKGPFTPKNPQKYVGNIKNIVFRSSWELKFFRWLDTNKNVKRWGSEEIFIPYYDPVTQQHRRYFPDVFIIIERHGKEEKIMCEIKPWAETVPPEKKFTATGKPSNSYLMEEATYQTNQAKWEAARAFCKEHNVKFLIMNEYDLGIKKR
jgi:hypothetical protein